MLYQEVSSQFVRYIDRVYDFTSFVAGYRDSRRGPSIPAQSILLTLLLTLWGRLGSLNQAVQLGCWGGLQAWLQGARAPGRDTLGRAAEAADVAHLHDYNHKIVTTARYNKVHPHGTIAGWRVASADGMEIYTTRRPSRKVKDDWCVRRIGENKQILEYYMRVLGVSLIGYEPRLALALRPMRKLPCQQQGASAKGAQREKAEAEVSALLRVVADLDAAYGPWWCEILTLDALYAQGPVINEMRARHKDVVIMLKQENRHLVADADGLFADQQPSLRLHNPSLRLEGEPEETPVYQYPLVEIWDAEDLMSWDGVREPLRCLKVRERRHKRVEGEWKDDGVLEYHIVTTLTKDQINAETIWLIMHRRWDVENSLFNELTQHWHVEHCYTHDVEGIEAILALTCIAFNLQTLFAYRHLRWFDPRKHTLKGLAMILLMGMATTQWQRLLQPDSRPAAKASIRDP